MILHNSFPTTDAEFIIKFNLYKLLWNFIMTLLQISCPQSKLWCNKADTFNLSNWIESVMSAPLHIYKTPLNFTFKLVYRLKCSGVGWLWSKRECVGNWSYFLLILGTAWHWSDTPLWSCPWILVLIPSTPPVHTSVSKFWLVYFRLGFGGSIRLQTHFD